MNKYANQLFGALGARGGDAHWALKKIFKCLEFSADGGETVAYHAALADVCRGITDEFSSGLGPAIELAVEAAAFLDRFRPIAHGRSIHRRTRHYWAAMEAWAQAVLAACDRLPRVCRPASAMRDARWYAAFIGQAVVPVEGPAHNYEFVKQPNSTMWILRDSVVAREVGHPVSWHVLSGRDVSVYSSEFVSADGKRVVAIRAYRRGRTVEDDACAACEAIDGEFSRWRVARGRDADLLCVWALATPNGAFARVGDIGVYVGGWARDDAPMAELDGPFTWLQVEPRAFRVIAAGNDKRLLHFMDPVDRVTISHPDHYTVEITRTTTSISFIELNAIPGYTYPPTGNEND